MHLVLKDELPFVSLRITYGRIVRDVSDVLLDTGSQSTMISASVAAELGIFPQDEDILHTMRGVGGTEAVFTRRIDRIAIDSRIIDGFEIEVGGMDYGFVINGILGMDYLLRTGALIDLQSLTILFPNAIDSIDIP